MSRRVDAMTAERPEVRWSEKLVSKLAWRDVEVWERDLAIIYVLDPRSEAAYIHWHWDGAMP